MRASCLCGDVRWKAEGPLEMLHHCHCGRCGSVVPGHVSGTRMHFACGGLEGDPGAPILAHIFVASKAPWYEIPDSLPQHAAYASV